MDRLFEAAQNVLAVRNPGVEIGFLGGGKPIEASRSLTWQGEKVFEFVPTELRKTVGDVPIGMGHVFGHALSSIVHTTRISDVSVKHVGLLRQVQELATTVSALQPTHVVANRPFEAFVEASPGFLTRMTDIGRWKDHTSFLEGMRTAVGQLADPDKAVSYTHLTLPTICSV